jgi:hypothetical protein
MTLYIAIIPIPIVINKSKATTRSTMLGPLKNLTKTKSEEMERIGKII